MGEHQVLRRRPHGNLEWVNLFRRPSVGRRALVALASVDALLLVLHAITVWLMFDGARILGLGFDGRETLNADVEGSLPSWWQQWQLGAGAVLAFLVALWIDQDRDPRDRSPSRRPVWFALAAVLLLMSLDEAVAIHEHLMSPVRDLLHIHSGPLFFAWVVPGAALVAFLGYLAVRHRHAIPLEGRRWMTAGAVLFFAGAIGVEMLGGAYVSARSEDYGYYALVAIEEGLEMLGESLVLCGLFVVLRSVVPVGERGEAELVG